jgi:uncharacterized repeat protein (TIGR01451 family)
MAREAVLNARRRARRGVPVLSLGLVLVLAAGAAWSGSDVPKEMRGDEPEVAVVEVDRGAEAAPTAPLPVVGTSPRCAAVANSPLAEPDWYADECLGGVRAEDSAAYPGPLRVPGDLFYLHNIRAAGTFPSSVYTSPIPTYVFTLLGPNALPIFAVDFDNTATTLWGINNTTRGLGTYNLTTGAFTQTVVTTGIPAAETISGLKFDPTSSTVYVISTLKLFTLDLATGVATLVGPFTHAAPAMIDFAISNTGEMYGEDLNDNFYRIDKTTGATALVGPMGVLINFAQGMDFDNSDNTLYQFAYVGGGVNQLRSINPATGVSTQIVPGPAGPEHEGSVKVASTPPAPPDIFLDEVEPNDTTATAQPLTPNPVRVRGNLFRTPFVAGNTDVDVYSVTAPAGARLYAATMTSWSSGSQDSVVEILDVDGTTILETDDNDGALGTNSSAIGGTLLATGGTYYVRVRQFSVASLSGTIRPYDLYVRVLSGTPAPEVEPNNNGTPQPLPANGWISGVIGAAGDNDTFSFTANAGDTIVAIVDADPERDTPDWNPRLGVAVFNNFILVVDSAATNDGAPAEAIFMTAKTSGTYWIYIDEPTGAGAATFTYHASVSVIPAKNRTCTTFTGTGGPITDLGTTDFTISVPNPAIVDYLRVSVNATHPATADLDVTLIGPDGNEVFLFDDPGTNAAAPAPQIDTTLEDEAGIPMSTFTVHSGMRYIPEVGGRLEHFKGEQAQGTWTLRVRDDLTANAGTLNSWSIDVCTPAPRPACVLPGPAENVVYSSDFEAGDGGFTHSGTLDEWERGLPAFNPITTAHSGVNAWKTDLDNTYENSSNQDLISPPLNLTSVFGRITLNWWHKFNMESATFDNYWVEVREVGNPTSARRVFEWKGSTMTRTVGNPSTTIQQAAGWGLVQVDISDFAGRNVEARFHLQTDTSVQMTGIAVDDVLVTSCTQVQGQPLSNAAITKTDNTTTYVPGQVLTYTIVASNAGPQAMIDAVVTDTFPADLTNVSWTCVASSGSACGSPSGTGDINETVDLLVGGTATFTVTTTVSATPGPTIVNTATITVPPGTADPDPTNNSATDTDNLVGATPVALAVDTGGNGVYEPNEIAVVAPTWANSGPTALALTGTLSNHTGPGGATYTIPDAAADYGTIAVSGQASCTATGNCYSVSNTVTTRPITHWDSTAVETLSPLAAPPKTWTLHIGDSFTDVPRTSSFYRFIETILHKNVTGGCTLTTYCPIASTTREQMAVFVLVAKEPPGYTPPACVAGSELFSDVPASSPFCRWIEELSRRAVISGCGPSTYCPTAPATREAMAVFVLRTLDPTLFPPACVPPNLFLDVDENSPFCRWIEELANRGVVTGCGGGNYCPTADVSREQMSVFLAVTFSLVLYGI